MLPAVEQTGKRNRGAFIRPLWIGLTSFVVTCIVISSVKVFNPQELLSALFKFSPSSGRLGAIDATTTCEKSRNATHGFLCLSDKIWALKQDVYQRQERVQQNGDSQFPGRMGSWFQANYEPNFSCGLERRIGRPGDGGKWMCNPNRIPEVVKELKKKCLVFSFGSSNDFSFEASVLKDLPGCEVHTFDHTIVPRNVPKGVHFHSWGLGAKDYGSIRTLSTIMKHLNFGKKHSLEVLKLDIEGAEWDVFVGPRGGFDSGLLAQSDFPFARQILIELHPRYLAQTRKFFELMGKQGYVITHKEPNTLQGGKLTEYAFLKADMS